eukprot:217058_1
MSSLSTIVFTTISGICSIIMICKLFHFAIQYRQSNDEVINNFPKKLALISLFGYTVFVSIAFILYLIQLLYYIPSIHVNYTSYLCQLQTFNIAFFMMGKLAMYFFFMSLVHFAFRDSFLAYSSKLIKSTASLFSVLMCIIGGLYMTSIYFDFLSVGEIKSPSDCNQFKASQYTQIIIYCGATCDAIWSGVCLLLFYLRLRKLTALLLITKNMQHQKTKNPTQIQKNNANNTDEIRPFFPIILKLTILSFWCAFSTLSLGFGLWTIYPNLSSIIDSFINAFCVYLSFSFNNKLFRILCMPFISCKYCTNWRYVLNEANKAISHVQSKWTTNSTNQSDNISANIETATITATPQKNKTVNIHQNHISIKLDGLRAVIHNDTPISITNVNQTPHSDEYKCDDSSHTSKMDDITHASITHVDIKDMDNLAP